MAYVNQEKKAAIAPAVKAILKKFNLKGSLAVRHHSTLVLNVKSGDIDFFKALTNASSHVKDHLQVNVYHVKNNFTGKAKNFLIEVLAAMNEGNYDNSDIMTDYHSCGWYVDVNIGQWDKPYQLTGA